MQNCFNKDYIPSVLKALGVVGIFATTSFGATAYINQVGYRTNGDKEFALVDGAGEVQILDVSGNVVLVATPKAASNYAPSGQNVQLVDFSDLTTPGTYSISLNGNLLRSDLKVANKPFEDIAKASLKWFYYQRASMALESQYAGTWARSAGHPDNNVQFHNSTGKSGTTSSPKGWYDAGDYGKYIVNSGITTYTLLSLYEHFPEYFATLKWNIPAEGALPDLLAEIKYNLDWMLTMQAEDGGVYHKLTTLEFPGDVMPSADYSTRYIIGKGSAATFDFAAVMATASRVYATYDVQFATTCLNAAKRAYAWGLQNPNVIFSNPIGVSTGEYGDASLGDEKSFASSELLIATKDESYRLNSASENVPSWGDVSGLATYGMATLGDENAKKALLSTADKFVERTKSGFGVVMSNSDFVWGSNSVAANQGVWLLHAYYLTADKKYYNAAVKVLDYLLGKNPLDLCFMTGFGTKSPKMPHHRPSTADNVTEPIPGMLVGGPQSDDNSDIGSSSWQCRDYKTNYPATSYTDNRCSYATNEVAINWNAPFAYLASAIEALDAGYAPKFAAPGVTSFVGNTFAKKLSNKKSPKIYFGGNALYVEKNGKRYDLKGNVLK